MYFLKAIIYVFSFPFACTYVVIPTNLLDYNVGTLIHFNVNTHFILNIINADMFPSFISLKHYIYAVVIDFKKIDDYSR